MEMTEKDLVVLVPNELRLWDLWRNILEFNDIYFPNWRTRPTLFYSNAMAGEVGEICNVTKKLAGGGTNPLTKVRGDVAEQIAEEVFDVFIYEVLLVESLGIDLHKFTDVAYRKLSVLIKRMKNLGKG